MIRFFVKFFFILLYLGIVKEFREIGGVRIEDDVVITKDACKLLVDVPRTDEEIERFMKDF